MVLDCANRRGVPAGPELFKSLGAAWWRSITRPDGGTSITECGSLHPEKLQQRAIASRIPSPSTRLPLALTKSAPRSASRQSTPARARPKLPLLQFLPDASRNRTPLLNFCSPFGRVIDRPTLAPNDLKSSRTQPVRRAVRAIQKPFSFLQSSRPQHSRAQKSRYADPAPDLLPATELRPARFSALRISASSFSSISSGISCRSAKFYSIVVDRDCAKRKSRFPPKISRAAPGTPRPAL